ncbi:hypothetical protein ACFL2Z_02170 [Candidatus Eisenbacteria bacterium]|uniref:Uncharacterized protein n=1 Tax=Eiseniibacteriota bacterium TaxID=2212470 RepID=A0ABV6YNQ2_UNCEI
MRISAIMCALLVLITGATLAVAPRTISYQGVLKDEDGLPVANGEYEIVFRLYDDNSASAALLWQETDTLEVTAGVFSVVLGKRIPINLAFDNTYWLSVEVDGGGELSPRVELTSSPYAFRAAVAESTLAGAAVRPHDHDDRYYTESELNTAGTINNAANPVDWTKLKNVPEDFADGVDDVTSGGDLSLPYSGSTSSTASAFSVYNTGDGNGIKGEARGPSGRGVFGQSWYDGDVENYGGYFVSEGMRGHGVYGRAGSSKGNVNYGGFFYASGDSGRGVFGQCTGSSGYGIKGWASNSSTVKNYGGHFTAAGLHGIGVYGWAENSGVGRNFGGYFVAEGDSGQGIRSEARGPQGVGVAGLASHEGNVLNFGGFFVSRGDRGAAVFGQATGSSANGVWGFSSAASGGTGVLGTAIGEGTGVYGSSGGDEPGAGVYGKASMTSGRGVVGTSSGDTGYGVYGTATDNGATRNYGGYFTAGGVRGCGVYGEAANIHGFESYGGYFVGVGSEGGAIYAEATGSHGTAIFAKATAPLSVGLNVEGGVDGYSAILKGNVQVRSRDTGEILVELGEGLDYAEGFDVSEVSAIAPGTVLAIDPDQPGKLTISERPYDTKVAGIVAGAGGLGSGVRLGTERFDCDVALAGRVYCNVDASETGVEPGDLLTTSAIPGYAMKVTDYSLAQGAILGKAMERLAQGEQRQILVLVTLQ